MSQEPEPRVMLDRAPYINRYPETPERYLTLKQLAAELGFSGGTIRRFKVPRHTMGGQPRYLRTEVEAYFRSEEFKLNVEADRCHRALKRAEAQARAN